MGPIVTPAEMAVIDAEAPEPVEVLIDRAGWATAVVAAAMLDGRLYGKRIAVLAGKGNNGADGRSAAVFLERRGARCTVFPIGGGADGERAAPGAAGHRFDLVIDACFGTGLGRDFLSEDLPVQPGDTPVLAVDIPSGVDGLTGELRGHPLCATTTVTFAAPKPGLLLEPGRSYVGELVVADIGLDCARATLWHLGPEDVTQRWPRRAAEAHKWRSAVRIVGGSPGLTGAPGLAAAAALRAGAGYVAVTVPGAGVASGGPSSLPVEAVSYPAPADWADAVLEDLGRFGAAVVGPGLSGDDPAQLDRYLSGCDTPTVFDAGAIDGLAALVADRPDALGGSNGHRHVLTPHDGEFSRLTGTATGPGSDRIASVRVAAERLGAVVLLKGPTTVVAHPDGRALMSTAGDQRLATAGTGDVLSGVIAAGLAGGLDPFLAAGLGAELHGLAGIRGYGVGATAGDLPSQLAQVLSELVPPPDTHI